MSTDVSKEVNLKEVIKGAQGEIIKLVDFDQTKEKLIEIATKHKGFVVTEENLKEGKEARAEVREFRYGLQNILKHNKDLLNQAKKQQEDENKELIALIEPTEIEIDSQIKVVENKKEQEKVEKEKIENERISMISKKLADFRSGMEVKFQIGKTEEDLKVFDEFMHDLNVDLSAEIFAEFNFEAVELIDEFEEKRLTILGRIEEEKELVIERENQEKTKKDQEEKEKQLEAEKQKLEAEKIKEKEEQFLNKKEDLLELGFILDDLGFNFPNPLISGYSLDLIKEISSSYFRELKKSIVKEISEVEQKAIDLAKAKKEQEEKEQSEKIQKEKEAKELSEKLEKEESEKIKKQKALETGIKKEASIPYQELFQSIESLIKSSPLNKTKNEIVHKAYLDFKTSIDGVFTNLAEELFL